MTTSRQDSMRRGIEHFVSKAPFDPYSVDELTPEQERYYMASQWQLMWWKLKRHRLAVIFGFVLLVMYGSTLISEIVAPYDLHERHTRFIYAPPQAVHLFDKGKFIGPFVYGWNFSLNMENLKREYSENTAKIYPVRFFCRGEPYKFWGLIDGDFHLVCPSAGQTRWKLPGITPQNS